MRWHALICMERCGYTDNGFSNSAKSPSVNSGCLRPVAPLYMLSASAALRSYSAKMRSSIVPCATSL